MNEKLSRFFWTISVIILVVGFSFVALNMISSMQELTAGMIDTWQPVSMVWVTVMVMAVMFGFFLFHFFYERRMDKMGFELNTAAARINELEKQVRFLTREDKDN